MSVETYPVVEVEALKVHFPTSRRGQVVHAVDGVSFSLSRGESFGLIGESGSGKSTVGRAVLQLVEPTAGEIRIDGRNLADMRRRERRAAYRRLQMVFQDTGSALNPRVRIGTSLLEPLEVQGLADRTSRAKASETLARVGLGAEYLDRYPHELSGGQRQRVNIARALMLEPAVLVCDEAVSALDVSLQAEVLNLLDDLRRDLGLTYLFIGHDLAVVGHVTERIGVMYLGRLMEVGPTELVMTDPSHPYTAALKSAEPEALPASMRSRERIILTGDIPSPITPPKGCVFHNRCPSAQSRCTSDVPELRVLPDGRSVACHFPLVAVGEPTR